MCGIAGFNWEDKELGRQMNTCLAHRGPDAEDVLSMPGATLAHRRLAIIDLSVAANQPMVDTTGRAIIVFNGEIYNYKELRKELVHYRFKTESDTEVILAGYLTWGRKVVERLNGIFAFAIWDTESQTLFCARDHMGVKPFYYFWDEGRFIFASEIKAILTHHMPRELDTESFNAFMRVLYVPEPQTMYKKIRKLSPGSLLILQGKELREEKYYNPVPAPRSWSYEEARQAVHDTVATAVERQMVADVPVGVYLSGGIDSSIVLSSVSKVKKHVKTYSVGFDVDNVEDQQKFNRDFELAAETAKFFGAEHHPLIIHVRDVAERLEDIVGSIDDPISNPTAIAMAHLSKFAKKEVTVVLSGNGGDELFGGYERYRMSRRVDVIGSIPGAVHLLPQRIRAAYNMSALERLVQFEFEKDKRLSRVINTDVFTTVSEVQRYFEKYVEGYKDKTEALIQADLTSWLPDQALLLGDKMSMYGSLEERVPLLDREVVALAKSLPLNYKVTPFTTKKILKDAFRKELPEALFKEPKRGWFSPGAKWLRRPEVRALVQEVLSESYYAPTSKLFNWQAVHTMLDNHIEKREYNLTVLWAILTFQIWAKKYMIKP